MMTVTRMATPKTLIPVTVDTFEALGRGVGTRSADAYIGDYIGDYLMGY